MDENISHKTKQSLLWFTVLPFSLHFVRFANSIILARILSPADFGIIGIASILVFYCNSLTNFGFSNAIIQRKNISQSHYNTYFSFNLFISFLFFVLFNIFSQEIALFFNDVNLKLAVELSSLIFLISALSAVPMTIHRRNIHFKLLAQIEAFKVLISMAISLSLAMNGFGFLSIIYAMLVSSFLAMIIVRMSVRIKLQFSFQFSYFKELYSFGIWSYVLEQTKFLGDNVDKLFIGRLLNITELGFYDKAGGLAKMPYEQFANRLNMISFSTFSRVQSDAVKTRQYFSKLMRLNTLICFPVFFGLAAVAENFTLVLLGDKWAEIIPILSVLSISFLVASMMGLINSMNIASGYIKQQTFIFFVGVLLLIFSLILVVPQGIYMTAYVLFGYYFYLLISSFILLQKIINLTWFDLWDDIKPAMISTLVMVLCVITSSSFFFTESQLLNLVFSIFVGAIVYTICVVFIPFKQWIFIRSKVYSFFQTKL